MFRGVLENSQPTLVLPAKDAEAASLCRRTLKAEIGAFNDNGKIAGGPMDSKQDIVAACGAFLVHKSEVLIATMPSLARSSPRASCLSTPRIHRTRYRSTTSSLRQKR